MESSFAREGNIYGNAKLPQPLSAYAPTPESQAEAPWFRVSAEWDGGGFGLTLQFDDERAASAWAAARCAHRCGASVRVERRTFTDCRELTASEVDALAADLQQGQRERFTQADVDAYQALERRELAARGQLYPSGAA